MTTSRFSSRTFSSRRYAVNRALIPSPERDPYYPYVSLLLMGNKTAGAQNNTFLEGSTNNYTITRSGNATQGTFSPFSPTGWSAYFDGNRDYLSVASSTDFAFGTGDFTMECWVNGGPQTDSYSRLLWIGPTYDAGSVGLVFDDADVDNKITFIARSLLNGRILTSSTSVTDNQWYHVAVTRASGTFRLFVNGVLESTNTSYPTGDVGTLTQPLTIGSVASEISGEDFAGYVSNVRIVKGTALYTNTFTPPTAPLTAVVNTKLLTCQNSSIKDNSTNNFTVTRNGDVSTQSFSPFSPTIYINYDPNNTISFDTAIDFGGSAYFDGSGDYISSSGSVLGTGDVTIEFWFRPLSGTVTSRCIYEGRTSTTTDSGIAIFQNGLTIDVHGNGVKGSSAASAFTLGQWTHVAVVRTSGTCQIYINGVASGSSFSYSNDYTSTSRRVGSNASGSSPFIGYVSSLREVTSAVYTTNFTVPSSMLTAIAGTTLLLTFSNSGIFDATYRNTIETVDNAQLDMDITKTGIGSIEFDGTGDWLLAQDNQEIRLGTAKFTIEMWVYLSVGDIGSNRGLVGKGTASTGWLVSLNTTEKVVFTYTTSTITSTASIPTNSWVHIAVVREGTGSNQTKIYINGTNDGTGTVSTDFTQTNSMYIGADRAAGNPMKGYIDNLRITRGIARYTTNFTVPTRVFPRH